MPSLDDIYRKFGEVAEAAQLVETELGTMLLFFDAVCEGVISSDLKADGKRATDLLAKINRQTLGQLIKNTTRHANELAQLEPLLLASLEERNRLFHNFYRQHNFRRNSDAGRELMLKDLEEIHETLLTAFKALYLIQGTDLGALAAERGNTCTQQDYGPITHLPI